MAHHQTGIAITIKAFLPTGKTLKEQHDTLSMVMKAHENSDYSEVLKAAVIDSVKSEQKTRRVEDQPAAQEEPGKTGDQGEQRSELSQAFDPAGELNEPAGTIGGAQIEGDDEPSEDAAPEFIKRGRKSA